MIKNIIPSTDDSQIRLALRGVLAAQHENERDALIIEELGITHGAARIDVAVINGSLHGYELKSDLDTLVRLPEQMEIYNSVLDHVTLVVGKSHLYAAFNLVPDWWGVTLAKTKEGEKEVYFTNIREPQDNPSLNSSEIAKLLWRGEALNLLEEIGEANGVRSKPRIQIYERLASKMDQNVLRENVRKQLRSRTNWRSDESQVSSDG